MKFQVDYQVLITYNYGSLNKYSYCIYKLAAKTMSLFIKADALFILLYKTESPITRAALRTSLQVSSSL